MACVNGGSAFPKISQSTDSLKIKLSQRVHFTKIWLLMKSHNWSCDFIHNQKNYWLELFIKLVKLKKLTSPTKNHSSKELTGPNFKILVWLGAKRIEKVETLKKYSFFLKKIFLKTWVEYNLNHNHMAQWNLFDLVNNVILKFPANDL